MIYGRLPIERRRPDIAFDSVVVSNKSMRVIKKDLNYIVKVDKRLKIENSTIYCQNLGNIKDWQVEGY